MVSTDIVSTRSARVLYSCRTELHSYSLVGLLESWVLISITHERNEMKRILDVRLAMTRSGAGLCGSFDTLRTVQLAYVVFDKLSHKRESDLFSKQARKLSDIIIRVFRALLLSGSIKHQSPQAGDDLRQKGVLYMWEMLS